MTDYYPDLLNGVNFQLVDSNMSVGKFRDVAWHNYCEYNRIESMGPQYQQRLRDLIMMILARNLQVEVIDKCGDTANESSRQVISDSLDIVEVKAEWESIKLLILEALRFEGLNNDQMIVINQLVDKIPDILIDLMVELTGRLKPIPMADTPHISSLLAKMITEDIYDDDKRDN